MGSIKMVSFWVYCLCLSHSFSSICQKTQGVQHIDEGIQNGYVLLYDMNYSSPGPAYLFDNCGYVVKQWSVDSDYHPKLLSDGSLIYPSGSGLKWMDWDGNVNLSLANIDPGLRIVYEIILLDNGNLLCVGRRDLSLLKSALLGFAEGLHAFQYDVVVEIDPSDTTIVWEWQIIDHIIQERDSAAGNYGSVKDHPELLNMDKISNFDWGLAEQFMINGMDYNAELDQIVLSIRKMSEVIIIDHSTTTVEAAEHEGGLRNKGGDILYRWGNPENYGRGVSEDRELFFQHNPNWIEYGEYAGSIVIYNNGLARDLYTGDREHSSIDIITPPMNSNGEYILDQDLAYGPDIPNWRYTDEENPQNFYSGYTSGAEVLPNGNVFVTEGLENRLFEITMDKKEVWEYHLGGGGYLYRTEKYPEDYLGLIDRELVPEETIENPSSNVECEIVTSAIDIGDQESPFSVQFNKVEVLIESNINIPFNAQILNIRGQVLKEEHNMGKSILFNREGLPSGIYLLKIDAKGNPYDIEAMRFFQY